MPSRLVGRAVVGAAVITLVVAGSALADAAIADADVVTSGNQGTIDLGTVAAGSSHALDVGFDLMCTGTTHVPAGTTVTLTPTAAPPGNGSITATPGRHWSQSTLSKGRTAMKCVMAQRASMARSRLRGNRWDSPVLARL